MSEAITTMAVEQEHRDIAKRMVSVLRKLPHSPQRAAHILRMVRIAEGHATAESLGTPFCDAVDFCESQGCDDG